MQFGQFGLWIERVHLSGPAVHVQKYDVLGFGSVVEAVQYAMRNIVLTISRRVWTIRNRLLVKQ